jgi:hypothetical protein
MSNELISVPIIDSSAQEIAEKLIRHPAADRCSTVRFLSATGLYLAQNPRATLRSFKLFLEKTTNITVETVSLNPEPKTAPPKKSKPASEEPKQMSLPFGSV